MRFDEASSALRYWPLSQYGLLATNVTQIDSTLIYVLEGCIFVGALESRARVISWDEAAQRMLDWSRAVGACNPWWINTWNLSPCSHRLRLVRRN